jgi:hypothetical protein
MPDEVTLDVTTIEENVTVQTTAGDVVGIKVVAPTGPAGATGPAGPNSVTSATTSDGTANLSLSNVSTATATVSGLLTAGHIHGNLAGTLYTHVRTGEAMSKGDPFYISGFHVGSSQPIAMKADASNAAKMPAVGVMDADYANNTSGANGIISGTLSSIDTDGYAVNSPIYVADGGGYSNTAGTIPQQVGITERANANTGAFIVTNSKVIASSDVSDASVTGDANKLVKFDENGYIAVNLVAAANIIANSTLVIGDGNTTQGSYDFFSNTSHLQWYSDSALYGERSFIVATDNITSGSSWVYQEPNASGTRALTDNTSGIPDKLTEGTISGTTTFNTTSYTYGTGAAAAHRTALGLTTLATTTPAANVATFLATPTSANLASALTDENGTGGGFVRAEGATLTSPALVGPVDLTSQDANTSDRVMTRSLADTRYGQSLASYLSADGPTVNNSTTLINTGLELSLAVGLWYVDATLFFKNTTNGAGGKAKVVVASGAATNARGTAAIGNQVVNRIASASYLLTERSTPNPIATDGIFWANGILSVTADCVIRVQYAQGVAQATDSNSLAGSYLIAQKIN